MAKPKKSPFNQPFHWLRYRMGGLALRAFVGVFPWLPWPLRSALFEVGARASFVAARQYRRIMEENLSVVMGEKLSTRAQQQAVLRAAWRNFARGAFETIETVHASREKICSMTAIEGEEHLKRALAQGKGVIALSAHLGSFTMIGTRLAVEGYAVHVLVKQPRDKGFADLVDYYRARVGIHTIPAKPRREAVVKILGALRRNEIVLFVADEFRYDGVEVNFLGHLFYAPRGPVTLAARTGAAVVPMFAVRGPQDRLTLEIAPELNLVKTGDVPRDLAANAALFSATLEEMVRRHPDQWSWLGFRLNGRRPLPAKSTLHPAAQPRELKSP